jgi:hypothetical protein
MKLDLAGSALYACALSSNSDTSLSAVFLLNGFPKLAIARALPLDRGVPPYVPGVVDVDLLHVAGSFQLGEHGTVQMWWLRAGPSRPPQTNSRPLNLRTMVRANSAGTPAMASVFVTRKGVSEIALRILSASHSPRLTESPLPAFRPAVHI